MNATMNRAMVKAVNATRRILYGEKVSAIDLSNAYHAFSVLYDMVESLKDVRFDLLQGEIKNIQKMIKEAYIFQYKGIVLEDNKIDIKITDYMKKANLGILDNSYISKDILDHAIPDYSTLLFCLERMNASTGYIDLFCKEINNRLRILYTKLDNQG